MKSTSQTTPTVLRPISTASRPVLIQNFIGPSLVAYLGSGIPHEKIDFAAGCCRFHGATNPILGSMGASDHQNHPLSGFRGRDDASTRREVGKGMRHTCKTNSDACYARLCRHFHGQRPLSASARTPRRVFFACLGYKKGPRHCARAADASCAAGNATSLRGAWHGVAKFAGGGPSLRSSVVASRHHCYPKMTDFLTFFATLSWRSRLAKSTEGYNTMLSMIQILHSSMPMQIAGSGVGFSLGVNQPPTLKCLIFDSFPHPCPGGTGQKSLLRAIIQCYR